MMKTIRALSVLLVVLALAVVPVTLHSEDKFKTVRENSGINDDELGRKLTLYFYDALTGNPIKGASFALEGSSGVTDSDGKVVVKFPAVEGPDVMLYGLFEKDRYVPSKVPVHVMVGSVFNHRYSISPALPPGRIRIVLDWGKQPPDLDSHLVKHGKYHISFRDMRKFEDQALLDRDDVDGEGPETITVNSLDPSAAYTYFVHDYTHKDATGFGDFRASKARVMVFGENTLLKSYEVSSGKGRVWVVFEIKNGALVDVSRMADAVLR
jgi:hypothetical protein